MSFNFGEEPLPGMVLSQGWYLSVLMKTTLVSMEMRSLFESDWPHWGKGMEWQRIADWGKISVDHLKEAVCLKWHYLLSQAVEVVELALVWFAARKENDNQLIS